MFQPRFASLPFPLPLGCSAVLNLPATHQTLHAAESPRTQATALGGSRTGSHIKGIILGEGKLLCPGFGAP